MIWTFSRIAFPLLMLPQAADSEPIHRLNRDDENDRAVWLGYRVYDDLIGNHWSTTKILPLKDTETPSG